MASRGQIQIDVVADTSKFSKQVEQQLKAALKGLKIQPVTVDGDTTPFTRKIRQAQADADSSFKGMFEKVKKQSATAGKGIGSALVTGLITAVSSGVGPAVAATASLFAAIGPAALASVPVAAGVLSTLQVALFGVGDALKEVGSEQKKFDEAVANLSPNAKSFVQALRSMLPELTEVKNAVQDRFFAGFDKDLTTVSKNLLGPTKIGMTGVADQLNVLIRTTAAYAASSKGAEAVTGIFRATNQVLAEVNKAFGPILDKLLDYIVAGTDAKKVDSAFQTAAETLKSLGAAASNVSSAIGSVFSGLGKDGPAVAASLAEATKAVKDFLASAQAQDLLNTLGNTMDRVREIALQILGVLPSLTPAVTGLAEGGFGVLLGAVQGVLDVLTPLATSLGGQKELFTVIGGVIATTVIAVKAYQVGVAAVTAAQIAWNAITVTTSVVTTVATAAYNTARVAVLLMSVGFAQAGAAATVLGSALLTQVSTLAAVAAGWVRTAAMAALNTVRLVAYVVATNAVKAATVAWTAVQWLLNAAMTANPIGIVIAIIVALVAAIVIAYQKSDTFRAIVDGAFKAVGAAAIWLWENAIKPLWEGIVAAFNFIVAAARAWWAAVVATFNAVTSAASNLAAMVVGFFVSLRDGAAAQIAALIGFVSSIPGRILGVLGNVGRLLYNVGSSIVAGLRDGIAGAWHWVTDRVQSLINLIPSAIRNLLGIGSPSKVTMQLGAYTGEGFAKGVESQVPAVVAASRRIAGAMTMAPGGGSGFSGDVRGGDGASMQAPAGGVRVWPSQADRSASLGTLVIDSAGSQLDEVLVQVLSKAVRVRGGNVQKVIGQSSGGVR